MVPKNSGVPVSARFRTFPALSARKHILSGTLTSTVSVYSVRQSGINCGQKKNTPRNKSFAETPCSPPETMNFISGELCRLYVNSESGLCQGLFRLYKCQRLRRSRQKTARANKKQRRPLSCREWLTLFRKFAIICMIKDFQRICRYECSRFFG